MEYTRAAAGPARCTNTATPAQQTPTPRRLLAEQLTFSGRTIDVPSQVIAGKEDWGANRTVGGPMNIGKTGFTQFKGVHMVEGAGHWAHEEQPEQVSRLLSGLLPEHG